MTTKLKMNIHLAKRIEKVAKLKNLSFQDACVFLLKEVLSPFSATKPA